MNIGGNPFMRSKGMSNNNLNLPLNPGVDAIERLMKKRGVSQEQFAGRIGKESKSRLGEEEELIPEGYREGKLKQFGPEQMELFKQLFEYLGPDSFLARLIGGDESAYEEMEAPSKRQFNEVLGNIGSRFSGMGTGGRRSSGFQNTVSQAGSDFAQDLAGKRNELKRQALKDLMGMSESLLQQRPFDKFLVEKYQKPQEQEKPSTFDQILNAGGSFLSGLGGGFGQLAAKKFLS